ncbi:DUF2314 domain-containing protein [Microbulbifer hydrolyticus]|uniref:DUF2314 domain-containing protein n=1 Tax=Microbulbifer hydrolyticus TaxID=48074 RepID=A0A6P1TD81_9GAMM|nr:DUF2314 domain-containing protein [Microbulbifer hydrolyticus]MBB5211958.1 hypothetical protein [Microbulbifer hydrolyticus]QHQ39645.1 DUF2314 domain-containing protein [Microbulbifer hydrolyticus]
MNKLLPIIFFLLSSTLSLAGETNYGDMPTGIDQSVRRILDKHEEKSRSELPYFNGELENREGRTFYVVTRLHQGEFYEQVYVKVSNIKDGAYKGTIASEPMGRVDFNSGDVIEVVNNKVVDWLIVNPDGTEEGNLQGKTLDLFQVGHAAFISRMTPKNGKFSHFEVVSVLNPYTKQEIIDVVPVEIKQKVANYLSKTLGGSASEDGKEKYTYTFLRFPSWDIVE